MFGRKPEDVAATMPEQGFTAEEMITILLRVMKVDYLRADRTWGEKTIEYHSVSFSAVGALLIYKAIVPMPGQPVVNQCVEAFAPGEWRHFVDITPKAEIPSGIIGVSH